MRLYERVKLLVDLPEHELAEGQIGAIVDVYTSPRSAYEVEFTDEQGRTTAMMTLLPEQIASE